MTCVVSSERVVGLGFREGCIDLIEGDSVVVIDIDVVIGADTRIEETAVDVVLHCKGAEAEVVSTVEVSYDQWVEGRGHGRIIHFIPLTNNMALFSAVRSQKFCLEVAWRGERLGEGDERGGEGRGGCSLNWLSWKYFRWNFVV